MTGARSLDIPKIFKEMIVTPFFLQLLKVLVWSGCTSSTSRVKITSFQISLGSRSFWRLGFHQTVVFHILVSSCHNGSVHRQPGWKQRVSFHSLMSKIQVRTTTWQEEENTKVKQKLRASQKTTTNERNTFPCNKTNHQTVREQHKHTGSD